MGQAGCRLLGQFVQRRGGTILLLVHPPGHAGQHGLSRFGVVGLHLRTEVQVPQILPPVFQQHAHAMGVQLRPPGGQFPFFVKDNAQDRQEQRIGAQLADVAGLVIGTRENVQQRAAVCGGTSPETSLADNLAFLPHKAAGDGSADVGSPSS